MVPRLLFIAALLTNALCVELSSPRVDMASAFVSGVQTLLAGGRIGDESVDSIDVISTSISAMTRQSNYRLSEARYRLTGASAGAVVAFAGGRGSAGLSATIDVFNTTRSNWTTSVASLSQPSDEVIGAGAGSVILFAQLIDDNDTLVDMLDLSSMNWSSFSLPHRCWRAGVREGRIASATNITLLCEAGLWMLNVTARTWSLAAFTRPIDSPDAAAIDSPWLRQESAAMQYAALSLLSLCHTWPPKCYEAAAATSDQIAFLAPEISKWGRQCERNEVTVYEADQSAVTARKVFSRTIPNPRSNSTYGIVSNFVVIAGGLSVNIDLINVASSNSRWDYESERCEGNPQDPAAYCGDSGWVLSTDVTVAAGDAFTVPYPLVLNASLTLAPGASLVIPQGATLTVTNALTLSAASSVWFYGASGRGLLTGGSVSLGTNVTLYVRVLSGGWPRWTHAGPVQRLTNALTVDVAGDIRNGASVLIINAAIYGRTMLLLSSFRLRNSGVRLASQLLRLSRYACPDLLALDTASGGWLRLSHHQESATCGLGRDLLLIAGTCVAVVLLVLWAVRGALTPPPFSEPAPPLEKEETCSICLQDCEKPVVLRCRHRYCEACIEEWAKARNTCPICRQNIRSRAHLPVHGRLINFYVLSCYALLLLIAVSWVYFSANIVIGEVLVILLGFALMSVMPMLATALHAFGRQMDESSPHESGVSWAPLVWHVMAPLFALPLFLLSFSAVQLRYAGFFAMASLPCVDALGSVCLNANTVNPVGWYGLVPPNSSALVPWSDYSWTLPLANGTVLSLQQGGLASAMEAVGVAIHTVLVLSVLMLAVSIVHGVCVVRFPRAALTQFVARYSLPVLCFLSLLALIASAVCARVTHVFRGQEAGDQTWLQEGASLMRVALFVAAIQLLASLPNAVRGLRSSSPPNAEILVNEANEQGVELRRLDEAEAEAEPADESAIPVAAVSEAASPAVPAASAAVSTSASEAASEERSESIDRRPLLQSTESAPASRTPTGTDENV